MSAYLQEFEVEVSAVKHADDTACVMLTLNVHATDYKTAEEFVYNMFMQGAGSAVQAALPMFANLHVDAKVRS